MNILVIGGTLFIGRHLVRALTAAGHQVTILHRSRESGAGLIADRNDGAAVEAALSGHDFDVVYDNVYDWQRGTTAAQVEANARACWKTRLKRYVFMSSVAAYAPGLDRVESDGLNTGDSADAYSRNKAESELALFRMHSREGFPAVTLRPPFIYGPGNPYYREAFFWDRLRDGRPIIIPDDGSRLMQFVYVHDLVACCLRVLDCEAAKGQAFNVADPVPVTQAALVNELAAVTGKEAHLVSVRREDAFAAGGHPMGPKLYFAMYFDLPPITMCTDKARALLGVEPTPFAEGLRATYLWWREHNQVSGPDYTLEDELLSRSAAG